VPGEREGVVARRGRDDPGLLAGGRQQQQRVAAASLLEAACELREVLLEVDVAAADLRKELGHVAVSALDA